MTQIYMLRSQMTNLLVDILLYITSSFRHLNMKFKSPSDRKESTMEYYILFEYEKCYTEKVP